MKSDLKNSFVVVFLLISLFFIFFTNTYFTFDESLIYGASDGRTYMSITKSFPYFEENDLAKTHNQRFLFPYLIGLISSVFNLESFLTYRIVSILSLFVILVLLNKILDLLKLNNLEKIIIFSLIIFNPYFLRYYIALPTLINDVIFLISTELIILGYFLKNKKLTYLSLIIGFFSRQTAIVFILSFIIIKFIFKKSFLNFKDILIILILTSSIYFLNDYHSNIASGSRKLSDHSGDIFGLIYFFSNDFNIKKILSFLSYPFLSWLPLILVFFFLLKKKNSENYLNELNVFISISLLLIIIQPILAGPISAGKNIIRLTNLGYIMAIFLLVRSCVFKIQINKKLITISMVLFFLFWSSHPTYSNLKFIKSFLNYSTQKNVIQSTIL